MFKKFWEYIHTYMFSRGFLGVSVWTWSWVAFGTLIFAVSFVKTDSIMFSVAITVCAEVLYVGFFVVLLALRSYLQAPELVPGVPEVTFDEE